MRKENADRLSAAAPHAPSGLVGAPLDVGSTPPGAVMAFTRAAGAGLAWGLLSIL